MSRVQIDLPEQFSFCVELPVMISHVNRGDHLGNDQLIGLLNEARIRFMAAKQVNEYHEKGHLFVNADLAVVYKSEARYREMLKIEMAASQFHKYGCDIVYRVTEKISTRPVAYAKTAHIMLDPDTGKPTEAPPSLKQNLTR
jgi:acyl-CoA thioester hydrolase